MSNVFGLLSSTSEPIPLMGVKIEGDILGRGAKVKISQRFRNQEKTPVEAVYKFPLPEGSAICGFKVRVNGKTIQGQVEEREKAFELYDNALERGDGGMLLDEERPNIFTLSVGNLNPCEEALVEIEYVTLLDMEGQQVRFFLPTTISPRYIPDDMDEDNGIPENGRIHPPYSESVSYGLSVSLNIHEGGLLKSIDSPSHHVKVDHMKGDPVNVTFSAQSVRMDRDFILNIEYEESFASRAYRYQSGQEGFLQLDLLLETEPMGINGSQGQERQDARKEIIFVLDCSGSMSGDSIREAKKALEICLRGLESGSAFNMYRFGELYDRLFLGSGSYTEKSLDEALAFLKSTEANLGGTEILRPLMKIYSETPKDLIERDIILLTDGEVGNEDEIFDIVRWNQESTRVFSIGIGVGCNEYFIKGLARAGRGASEFIYPGERIEPKVLRLFSKITQKSLNNPQILWGEGAVEQAPFTPVIFLESPTTVFARCLDNDLLPEKITIKGHVNGQDREWEIEITESHDENVPLPILWARERIRDLEETRGDHKERGSRQRERKGDREKETILDLSKRYSILSQSTSFVAIEQREEKDKSTGELMLRKIPVLVTVGWHGIGGIRVPYPSPPSRASVSLDLSHPEPSAFQPLFPARRVECDESPLSYFHEMEPSQMRMPQNLMEAQDPRMDLLLNILSLQKATGGMELDPKISSSLGIDFREFKEVSKQIEVGVPVDKFLLLSTAILLRVLEFGFPDRGNMWTRVVRKSRDWFMDIDANGNPRIHGKHLMDWAEEFVRDNLAIEY